MLLQLSDYCESTSSMTSRTALAVEITPPAPRVEVARDRISQILNDSFSQLLVPLTNPFPPYLVSSDKIISLGNHVRCSADPLEIQACILSSNLHNG